MPVPPTPDDVVRRSSGWAVSVSTSGLWVGIVALSIVYTIVAAHTPFALYANARHDDGHYMTMGERLAAGEWLGPFDQHTLMKGPGYPLFLAGGHRLGLSSSVARALFHCAAITLSVVIVHRLIRSLPLSALLFVLLMWHPFVWTPFVNRVSRETIYPDQVLVFLATFVYVLFGATGTRERLLWAAFSGGSFGWLWLTREEGVWLFPGIVILLAAAAFRSLRDRRVRELGAALVVLVSVFLGTEAAFRTVNKIYYGTFAGVDFKETHFQRALKAIHSVRSGGIKPFVSVTRLARQRIYPVSPAFASLAPLLDGPLGEAWSRHSCRWIPSTCGELGAGWFVWAFRDAVARIGGYSTPARASAFFKQMADEITAACAAGALECRAQFVAEMPPVGWEQLAHVPRLVADGISVLLLLNPPTQVNPSTGDEAGLARRLKFLNYPRYSDLASADSRRETVPEKVSRRLREAIAQHYRLLFMPILMLGIFAFFGATIRSWRGAGWSACYVVALTCGVLVGTRTLLMAVIDATWFPSLNPLYFAPSYFLLICGAVFSIASWMQLRAGGRSGHPGKAVAPLGNTPTGSSPEKFTNEHGSSGLSWSGRIL